MAISNADKLALFNGAIRVIGESTLANLTESREIQRQLSQAWDDGAVKFCLEQAQWKFALCISQFEADPDLDVQFGRQYAFTIPDDLVRVSRVSLDERFDPPYNDYMVANQIWYADVDSMYVEYVSSGDTFGMNYSIWPPSFKKFVQAYLAFEAAPTVVKDEKRMDALEAKVRRRLQVARSISAQQGPTQFPPDGSWVSSRGYGIYNSRRDHPNRNSLY